MGCHLLVQRARHVPVPGGGPFSPDGRPALKFERGKSTQGGFDCSDMHGTANHASGGSVGSVRNFGGGSPALGTGAVSGGKRDREISGGHGPHLGGRVPASPRCAILLVHFCP